MVKLLVRHGAEVERAREGQRVAASSHGRAATHVPAERRAHAAALRGARGLPRVCASARRGRRKREPAGPEDMTPLFLAVDNFHFDLAKYLLEAGANPNKWDWWGRTPLYSAVDLNTLPHGGRADRLSTTARRASRSSSPARERRERKRAAEAGAAVSAHRRRPRLRLHAHGRRDAAAARREDLRRWLR